MKRTTAAIYLLAAITALVAAAPAVGTVPSGPAWQLSLIPMPTKFKSATTGGVAGVPPRYRLIAVNVGGAPTSGPVSFSVTLPADIGPSPSPPKGDGFLISPSCAVEGQIVACSTSAVVEPGRWIGARIPVEVTGALGVLADAEATIAGGGALSVTTSAPSEIANEPSPFDFLSGPAGVGSLLTAADGSAPSRAGGHPDQLTVNFGFPTDEVAAGTPVVASGHVRDLVTDLPRGLVVNPNATFARCTEAQLIFNDGTGKNQCPLSSQVGTFIVMTELAGPTVSVSNVYNMVPPPGEPAKLGFQAFPGVFIHVLGRVRTGGDYGLSASAADVIARTGNPILSAQIQLWGDPAATSHDGIRGICRASLGSFCPVPSTEKTGKPLLTMPSACAASLVTVGRARSWEEAAEGIADLPHAANAENTETQGNPVAVNSCSTLEFEPTLTVQPEESAAESPTGVKVRLDVPQNEGLGERATSNVRDTTIALPAGMALNPAAAAGLDACTPAQIDLNSAARPSCPDSSKIGTVEVDTPLLAHTVPGAVYVAKPYDNPFNSLLGVYVVIDSPDDGVVIKLAGKTEADPNTGRLTTTFQEAPELPFGSFEVDLFGGSTAALRTPSTCGTFATHGEVAPWSGKGPVPTIDSFDITDGANGTPCRSSEAEMPNAPGFQAGTAIPLAANYSPFGGRLTRGDGEQQLKALSAILPPGLTGKLAGVQTCPDAAIAAASAKTGQEELASPSCPASSEIGEVTVGAGAGPAPYYTSGKIYLAGPYKGAPLSGVAITPAVAGPFDLGTVAVRAPAYVDPVTAQLSLKSDDFPHILEGIPLELRDARLSLNRSEFTLNPSSCDVMAISGEAVSLLGNSAPLAQRFQAGGCRGLDYAPKLFIRLRGGTRRGAHPKLRAVLVAKPGQEANTAKASVALPRSEFLENAHIRTVCTRVQFAAKQCPKGAIYGYAKALTPLLDEPVKGPIYLRSSDNELPDMVAALHGPPGKPIELELKGRIDSVRGGIRTTFDLVPDQPVNKAIFWFKGGNRGLIVNSRDTCARTYRATARFDGQNGKTHDFRPKLKACKKKRNNNRRHRRQR